MAIVEIIGAEGSVPIRIEMPSIVIADEKDVYADRDTRGLVKQTVKAVVKTTEQIYEEAIAMACATARQTVRQIEKIEEKDRPAEFEVTFGLSLGLGADTRIVKADSSAEVTVRMQWDRRPGV